MNGGRKAGASFRLCDAQAVSSRNGRGGTGGRDGGREENRGVRAGPIAGLADATGDTVAAAGAGLTLSEGLDCPVS